MNNFSKSLNSERSDIHIHARARSKIHQPRSPAQAKQRPFASALVHLPSMQATQVFNHTNKKLLLCSSHIHRGLGLSAQSFGAVRRGGHDQYPFWGHTQTSRVVLTQHALADQHSYVFLVESPTKAKKIQKFLGDKYKVCPQCAPGGAGQHHHLAEGSSQGEFCQ